MAEFEEVEAIPPPQTSFNTKPVNIPADKMDDCYLQYLTNMKNVDPAKIGSSNLILLDDEQIDKEMADYADEIGQEIGLEDEKMDGEETEEME